MHTLLFGDFPWGLPVKRKWNEYNLCLLGHQLQLLLHNSSRSVIVKTTFTQSTCIYIFISWLHQQWNLAKKVSCIRSWITEKRKECLICFVTVECSNKVYTASIGYPRVPRVPQKTQGARMTQAQSTLGRPSAPGGQGNQVTSTARGDGTRVPQGGLVNSATLIDGGT